MRQAQGAISNAIARKANDGESSIPRIIGQSQLSGKQSVPKRGSVGSPLDTLNIPVTNNDPTLPRFGTDCFPLSITNGSRKFIEQPLRSFYAWVTMLLRLMTSLTPSA